MATTVPMPLLVVYGTVYVCYSMYVNVYSGTTGLMVVFFLLAEPLLYMAAVVHKHILWTVLLFLIDIG